MGGKGGATRGGGAGGGHQRGEFTPMLRSVVKSNHARRHGVGGGGGGGGGLLGGGGGVPPTPAALKPGYQSAQASPSLPFESTGIVSADNSLDPYDGGGCGVDGGYSNIAPMASSSAVSTPLAALPRSDRGGAVVTEGQNVMTLREQENVRFLSLSFFTLFSSLLFLNFL